MKFDFYKYHGTGNDFILIDNREGEILLDKTSISLMCDRHRGVGADGLIILNKYQIPYDFGMLYYNSDGNQSTMCGNGGRCIVSLAKLLGLIENQAHFNAIDGEHIGLITDFSDNITHVKLKMKDITVPEVSDSYYFIDSGSPHYVKFIENIEEYDVVSEGRKIRYSSCFIKDGTNVDFVKINENCIYVRSYERGVENETLSCGTGVVASAIAYSLKKDIKLKTQDIRQQIKVKTPGGELAVEFKRDNNYFSDVWLEGPTTFVFKGSYKIN